MISFKRQIKNQMIRPMVKKKSTISIPKIETPLSDKMCDKFLMELTPEKVRLFSSKCKEKMIETRSEHKFRKEPKLKKYRFLNIMRNIFSQNNTYYNALFLQLFNKFKIIKCSIQSFNSFNSHPATSDNFYINKFVHGEDEINIFDISCALVAFLKCDFKEKIKILFELTDSDDDGLIDKSGLKKLIFTMHNIFSEEETPIKMDSTVIHQSFAAFHSQQVYMQIIYYPGELGQILTVEKFINFDHLYNAIIKIPEYKYKLFPFYIDLKKSLLINKKEKEFSIKHSAIKTFSQISSEMLNQIKVNNIIVKEDAEIKKIIEDLRQKDRKGRNRKMILNKFLSSKLGNKSSNINLYQGNTRHHALSFDIELNKLNNLETYPGSFNVIENETTNTNKGIKAPKHKLSRMFSKFNGLKKCTKSMHNITNTYMTDKEVISEIDILINKHKAEDIEFGELIKIKENIDISARKQRRKLKNMGPYMNMMFWKIRKNSK